MLITTKCAQIQHYCLQSLRLFTKNQVSFKITVHKILLILLKCQVRFKILGFLLNISLRFNTVTQNVLDLLLSQKDYCCQKDLLLSQKDCCCLQSFGFPITQFTQIQHFFFAKFEFFYQQKLVHFNTGVCRVLACRILLRLDI